MKENEIFDIAFKGNLAQVKNLIAENENIIHQRFENHLNRNILHFAAGNPDPLVMMELLKYADSNTLDDNDLMPIHMAAIFGNFPVITVLMHALTKEQLPTITKDLILYLKANNFESYVTHVEALFEALNSPSIVYPSPTIYLPPEKYYPGFFKSISYYLCGTYDNVKQLTNYSNQSLEIKKAL